MPLCLTCDLQKLDKAGDEQSKGYLAELESESASQTQAQSYTVMSRLTNTTPYLIGAQ